MSSSKTWSKHISEESQPLLERIGAIGLLFSALERSLDEQYLWHATRHGLDHTIVSRTFLQLARREKNVEIAHLFKHYRAEQSIVDAIENLIDCFSWCAVCRNSILHSEIYPTLSNPKDVLTISKRVHRTSEISYTKLTAGKLDRVADFIHACWMQSAEIHIYLRYRDKKDELPDELRAFAERLPTPLKKPKMLESARQPYLLEN